MVTTRGDKVQFTLELHVTVSAKPETPETSGQLKRLLYSRQSPAPQKPATRGATVVMPVAPFFLAFGFSFHALRSASVMPPSVSAIAATSRTPKGSPRMKAAETTPITGTSSMPVDAEVGGRRRSVSNQVR